MINKLIFREGKPMDSLFIAEIPEEFKNFLDSEKIAYAPLEIAGTGGVVLTQPIDERYDAYFEPRNLVVEVLNDTGFRGLRHAVIRVKEGDSTRKKLTVTVDGFWDGYQQNDFERITKEILLPVVDKNIIIQNMHGKPHSIEDGNDFHIWLWSGIGERADFNAPRKIWDITVGRTDCDYRSSGLSEGLVLKSEQHEVAEYTHENIYIFHDITHEGTDAELKLYRMILVKLVEQVKLTSKERKELYEKRELELDKNSKKHYVEVCGSRKKVQIKELLKRKKDIKVKIVAYQKKLIHYTRAELDLVESLAMIRKGGKGDQKNFEIEFKNLISNPKVKKVRVTEGKISVFTKVLFCQHPKTKEIHELGEFRIDIYFNETGREDLVLINNLTRRVRSFNGKEMHAPHVFPDGRPCWGNVKSTIWQQVAAYQFSVVILLIMQFLESVNLADDAGIGIRYWPTVTNISVDEKEVK